MLVQHTYIDRVRHLVSEDARFVASLMYGSFTRGDSDRHSDVEFYFFLKESDLNGFDRRRWVEQIAPVEHALVNEYGTYVVIFDSLVRGEFHFEEAGQIADVSGWVFERIDPERMLIKDLDGALRSALQSAADTPCWASDEAAALEQSERLLNWLLLATNVFERGEYARAVDALSYAHRFLLRGARLREVRVTEPGKRDHWLNPTRSLEERTSAAFRERYGSCIPSLNPESIRSALQACWEWGLEQSAGLGTEAAWRKVVECHPPVLGVFGRPAVTL